MRLRVVALALYVVFVRQQIKPVVKVMTTSV